MCLGLFLFREGMRRELTLARTVERLVVEAEEGRQAKLVTIRGTQKVLGFSEVQRWNGDIGGQKKGFIAIKDPENPKSWYEFDMEHAIVCEEGLIHGILEGKYDTLDTSEIR